MNLLNKMLCLIGKHEYDLLTIDTPGIIKFHWFIGCKYCGIVK